MMIDFPGRLLLLAVVCLLPAATTWWSGRTLMPQLDDPLLPERLGTHRHRNRIVLWLTIVLAGLLGGLEHLIWTVPLAILGRMAANFRLRRAIWEERWTFGAYVSCMGRLLLAAAGYRVLLALVPALAAWSGRLDWVTALALGIVLFFWHDRQSETFRRIMRAEPLGGGPLLARFKAIAAKSRTPEPRFELVDLRGGSIANALALASRHGSTVLYSDTLLRLLDADEAAAITAHEIAHLEHYDAAYLRREQAIMTALIVAAAAGGLLPRLADLSLLIVEAVWCSALVMALAWIARDRQRNETASDLRAVELSGDPEALVRALTKAYTFSRVPRRWDTQTEHIASHPSLARRIRAIRQAAGAAPAPSLAAPETVRSVSGHPVVTFASDALHWQESEGALHVLAYSHLTELRVAAQKGGGMCLVALERGGRRWVAPLDAEAAARAQAVLDRVDGRLAEPGPASYSMPWLQAAGVAVAVCAMWAGQFVVAFVALGATMRSAAAFFAAAGAAAVAGAVMVGRQVIAAGDLDSAWPGLLLMVFGGTLLYGAWRKRQDASTHIVNLGVGALGVLALGSVVLVASRGVDAVSLNQASLAVPSGAILPLALAAALAIRPRRAWRLAAIPVCIVGVTIGIVGSGTFLHAFGRDPFLVSAPPLAIEHLDDRPIADFALPGVIADVRLSPTARQIATMSYGSPHYPAQVVARFAVGAPGAESTPIDATDLVFLDDERVLTLNVEQTAVRLREVTLPSHTTVREQLFDKLVSARLAYRRAAKRWLITGIGTDGQFASIDGAIGSDAVERRTWRITDPQELTDAWAIRGNAALVAQQSLDFDPLDATPWSLTMAAMLSQPRTRLTRITPDGSSATTVSQLPTSCSDRVLAAERLVCFAYDGSRTQLLTLDPAHEAPQAVGSITGRFMGDRTTSDGWITGWMYTGTLTSPAQLAIDVGTGRAVVVPRLIGASQVAIAGHLAATLRYDGSATRVRVYDLASRRSSPRSSP